MTSPVASVVIPAHNEAPVIGRLLDALATGLDGQELQVIVGCNACTDDTAQIARARGATVVETSRRSKVEALNAAEMLATHFPRYFIDADVVVTGRAVLDIADALRSSAALCAAPPMHVNVEGRPWPVRAFYRVWMQTTYVRQGHVGSGVFVMTAAGRARFTRFPDIIADDQFARNLFERSERVVVPTAPFVVEAPWNVRALLRRRTRIYVGNLQLAFDARFGGLPGSTERSESIVRIVAQQPQLVVDVLPYLAISIVAKTRARRLVRRQESVGWGRDETTRRGSPARDEAAFR